MKTHCDIINDLLPVYCDGVCSEESKTAVEEHLQECEACREKYNLMNVDFVNKTDVQDENKEVKAISKAVRKIQKKYILIGCLIVLSFSVVILLSIIGYHFFTTAPENNIEALEKNAEKYLSINGYSELEIVKTEKRGDYLAALCADDKGTWTLCVFFKDEIFENRWRAWGGTLGAEPGELSCYSIDDSNGLSLKVAFGGEIPDEVCWYTFENSQTIYYRPVKANYVLDVFVFPSTGDINGVPEPLDKDKNPIEN